MTNSHLFENVDSYIYTQRWTALVNNIGIRGRYAFEKSGITVEELGTVVREMSGDMSLNRPLGVANYLFTMLGERFRKGDASGEALLDVHTRRSHALFAAFATSFHLRERDMQKWLHAALMLHLNRQNLFTFMLVTKFGIEPDDIKPHLAATLELFDSWVAVFGEDLPQKKEG